jgi:hypothetical protein
MLVPHAQLGVPNLQCQVRFTIARGSGACMELHRLEASLGAAETRVFKVDGKARSGMQLRVRRER